MDAPPDADIPAVADAPRKTRPPTSPLTWAGTVAVIVAAAVGGYWWYVTGPGRTVDTSAIQPGMSRFEVAKVLGDPDQYVTSGDETAMRYGRTHIWVKNSPGGGVSEITTGPR